jgi:cytochrome c oxidase cbb3-type subunit IV
MKYKHYLETIAGIEIYPLFSLIVFTTFFAILIIWVLNAKKDFIEEMSELPLRNEDNNNIFKN